MDEEHQLLRDSSGLYALGALSPREARGFARHLETCDECAAEALALRTTVDILLFAAALVEPPASLRARVLTRCRMA